MAGRWDNSDLAALIARDAKLRHYELPPEQGQDEKDRPDSKAEGGGEGAMGEDTIEYQHDPRTLTVEVRVKTGLGARAAGRVEYQATQQRTMELAEQLASQLLKVLHAAAKGPGKGKGEKGDGKGDDSEEGDEADGDGNESKEKKEGKGKGKGKGQSQEEWFAALKRSLTGILVTHGYSAEGA